jgi:RNA recognition motif-containing protein
MNIVALRFMCSQLADRSGMQRDDLPLPTQPPYTAFIGNLAFDLTEMELEDLFSPLKVRALLAIRNVSQ